MMKIQKTIFVSNDGTEFMDEASCLAHEKRADLDAVIEADDLYYYSELRITGCDDLIEFLERHEDVVKKAMGWE